MTKLGSYSFEVTGRPGYVVFKDEAGWLGSRDCV